jgi:5-methylcytosine-specific restriction endonuclease McrBC GTP-binding regulatory subunit McrB
MNENLYKLKQDFLDNWSLEKLEKMTLEEYTDTNRENSFCYWLEHITRDLGSIVGGSSYKFGIYKMGATSKTESATNRDNDGVYAWHTKYGSSANEAFETIKRLIVNVANYSSNDQLSLIDNIDLGDAFKWKIAFLYSDFKVINIFKKIWLINIAYGLDVGKENLKISELNNLIVAKKPEDEDYFHFSNRVRETFGDKENDIKDILFSFENWLKKDYRKNDGSKLGSGSVTGYLSGVKFIAKDLYSRSFSDKDEFYRINEIEILEDLKKEYFDIEEVNLKNQKGNKRISNSFSRFIEFKKASNNQSTKYRLGATQVEEDALQYDDYKNQKMNPTNQILYGPPGTGKTYYLKEQLFDKYTVTQSSFTRAQYLENFVIDFTWWQLITMAVLDLKLVKTNDLLSHELIVAKSKLSSSKNIRPILWSSLQTHSVLDCENVKVEQRIEPLIFTKDENSKWSIIDKQLIELYPEAIEHLAKIKNFTPNDNIIVKNYDFVTFHQSFAYEDFIEGIKPVLPENEEETADLGYQIEDGVFKKLCIRGKNDPENRYAIFIDEINRGNVSAIFGELITLIELDKRKGEKNELTIKLPYSKKEFSVPSNIDIYGTMNTADRSVEALDTALRRRFEFKEMMPDYNVIANEVVNEIQLSEVLKTINDRIELLIDRDHTIGHSYFVGVNTPEKLANAFNNKIAPLLQEYFYGDYGKIGLVLGKGFVENQKNDTIKFAAFSYENANDFITSSYTLKKVEKDTVVDAVQMLLGKTETE